MNWPLDQVAFSVAEQGCTDWRQNRNSVAGDVGFERIDERVGLRLFPIEVLDAGDRVHRNDVGGHLVGRNDRRPPQFVFESSKVSFGCACASRAESINAISRAWSASEMMGVRFFTMSPSSIHADSINVARGMPRRDATMPY